VRWSFYVARSIRLILAFPFSAQEHSVRRLDGTHPDSSKIIALFSELSTVECTRPMTEMLQCVRRLHNHRAGGFLGGFGADSGDRDRVDF
jgi:hypothetical protein